jgi:hypothetical protein
MVSATWASGSDFGVDKSSHFLGLLRSDFMGRRLGISSLAERQVSFFL